MGTYVILSFVCYLCATLQNSVLFTTISENTSNKKTLENAGLSRVLSNLLFCLKLPLAELRRATCGFETVLK